MPIGNGSQKFTSQLLLPGVMFSEDGKQGIPTCRCMILQLSPWLSSIWEKSLVLPHQTCNCSPCLTPATSFLMASFCWLDSILHSLSNNFMSAPACSPVPNRWQNEAAAKRHSTGKHARIAPPDPGMNGSQLSLPIIFGQEKRCFTPPFRDHPAAGQG